MWGALFCLAVVASEWRILARAGRPGWIALVPVYNAVVLFDIAGRPRSHAVAMVAAATGAALARGSLDSSGGLMVVTVALWMTAAGLWFSACLGLADRFGRSMPFAIGMMLAPWLFMPALAFGVRGYRDEHEPAPSTLGVN